MIRKLKSGQWRLYSRKKDPRTGKPRNLGTFPTRAKAGSTSAPCSISSTRGRRLTIHAEGRRDGASEEACKKGPAQEASQEARERPLVGRSHADEQRPRPGARRLHLEGPGAHRGIPQALGRDQQAPQGRSLSLRPVDAHLPHKPGRPKASGRPKEGAGAGESPSCAGSSCANGVWLPRNALTSVHAQSARCANSRAAIELGHDELAVAQRLGRRQPPVGGAD